MSVSKSFCVLPWIHLATHPNGGASLCCRSNHKEAISWAKKPDSNSLVMLDDSQIREIMNSDKFVEVRTKMLAGDRPVECEGCWRDEDAGIKSKREYENERWADIIPTLELSPELSEIDLIYIELRLGNICNNACLTCNSYSSSRWYPDEKKIASDLPWFTLRDQENFKWFEKPEFYEDLAKSSRSAQEIYINGGEPTLIRAHYLYLQDLIDSGAAKNVHLVYSLNMMDIPDTLVDLWKGFKKVTINASIDDVDDRNYYIRYPTKWDEVLTCINKLNSVDTVDWHVTQTVSILNVFNLDKLGAFLKDNFDKTPHHNYVLYPEYFNFSVLTESVKHELAETLKGRLSDAQYNELLAKLTLAYDEENHIKAKQFIAAIDKARKLNYTNYIPELDKIL